MGKDCKSQIINNVVLAMSGSADPEVLRRLQDVLSAELQKYKVDEQTTELMLYDDSSHQALKKFIVCKQIEGISAATLKRYFEINRELLNFFGKSLREYETNDIRYYLGYCRQTRNLANRTLDGMRRCYSSFFGWCAAEGLIDRSPCLAVKKIKYRKDIKKPFTSGELERIREACNNIRDLALVDFLYSTGVRVSECVNLDISDVDFESREIIVLGKGDKERRVYLSEVAAMHLKDYLDSRKDLNEALFVGKGTARLKKTGIEAALRKIGQRAKVSNVHPHRFRRTLATSLLNKGMDIVSVAEILGHADLRTTQIYCTINPSNVKYHFHKLVAA